VRSTLAIVRKELEVYFTTPIAYVVLMLVVFLSSLVFNGALDAYRYLSLRALSLGGDVSGQLNLTDLVLSRVYAWVGVWVLLAAPFLSMRLFAEEKRARTFELLMTVPVRPIQIVLGKYLAALATLSVAIVLALAYPLALALTARATGGGSAVEWQTVATGLAGVVLLAAMALAVGTFVSALTDSMAVAALAAFFLLAGLALLPLLAVTAEGPLKDIASALSPVQHLVPFVSGKVELKSVVYFLSFTALGLYLTDRAVEGHRWI